MYYHSQIVSLYLTVLHTLTSIYTTSKLKKSHDSDVILRKIFGTIQNILKQVPEGSVTGKGSFCTIVDSCLVWEGLSLEFEVLTVFYTPRNYSSVLNLIHAVKHTCTR